MTKIDTESCFFKVKLAQEARRFDDMSELITEIMETNPQPNLDEIELLSLAFKNCVVSRRIAWKVLKTAEIGSTEYQALVKNEVKSICDRVLGLINDRLIPNAIDIKPRLMLLKLIGDFNRYLAEVSEEEERKTYAENAAVAYKEASELAVSELPATDVLRLATALNFSVFFSDILYKSDKALEISKSAYADAISHLDALTDETYRDTIIVLQLLKENIFIWEMAEQ